MEFIEVELKFPLLNHEALVQRLDKIAVREKMNDFLKDVYFTPVHRNFIAEEPTSEWLRIRTNNEGKSSINYKDYDKKKNGANTVHCDEFETEVGSERVLEKIFGRLDFREICVVEKKRSTWNFKDVEIAIDDVKDLGWFIELECKGSFSSIEEAKKHLYSVVKELDAELGEQDFKGYPKLLIEKKKRK